MNQCEYENNSVRCKNWVASSEETICALHKGVVKRDDQVVSELFKSHTELVRLMSSEELVNHLRQLDELIESMKVKKQASHAEVRRRIGSIVGMEENSVKLSAGQLSEIDRLRRGSNAINHAPKEPALSKQEKEIQGMMKKYGMDRKKAMSLLGIDEES